MPVDPLVVPTLIEVGRRTVNVLFMILSEKLGDPDPSSAVEVTMFPGSKFRLTDSESREWIAKLAAFVPRASPEVPARTKVIRRRNAKVSGE